VNGLALVERVLRWPRRVARAGLFLCEGAVEQAPIDGARLGWIAENLAALAGIDVEVIGEPPPGVLVLADARLVPALAVLAHVPVDAVGPSLTRFTGLGRAPVTDATVPIGASLRVLLTVDDGAEVARAAALGLPIVPVTVEPVADDAAPGFLAASARPATRLRVRFDVALSAARAA
jgi:hypothetical protein